MASVLTEAPSQQRPRPQGVLPLENGAHLSAAEFLRRYESMPEVKKAELIPGDMQTADDDSGLATKIETITSPEGVPLLRLQSESLTVEVAPSVGGRIVSIRDRASGHEFLWRNAALRLECLAAGSEYDPNFYGGMDELLPNDMPETIDGIDCPDHGELWTTPLAHELRGRGLVLSGRLPRAGLVYQRQLTLRTDAPWIELAYRLSNPTVAPRHFLWKLHPALNIEAGDFIECPAQQAQVVDLAWSRQKTLRPFPWPRLGGQTVNVVPAKDGTMDFFYLCGLKAGRIAWHCLHRGLSFACHFDLSVFPYAWLFASYGGFNGHYTVILEPCSAMPMSVNVAAAKGQCTRLEPGEVLETKVAIYAGPTTISAPTL